MQMSTGFSFVRYSISEFVRELTTPTYCYSTEIAQKVQREMTNCNFQESLAFVYEKLRHYHAGCCFNYACSLAYCMMQANMRSTIAIVTTPEPTPDDPTAQKVSVAYVADGEIYVCDIVEYVKGNMSYDDCCCIPFDEFQENNGPAILHDCLNTTRHILWVLYDHAEKLSPEEFVSREEN